jgi:hypothetical protein
VLFLLAIGAVVFTTLVVGWVAHMAETPWAFPALCINRRKRNLACTLWRILLSTGVVLLWGQLR